MSGSGSPKGARGSGTFVQSHTGHEMHGAEDTFPTDVDGLAEANTPEVLELADGDLLDLRIAPVATEAAGGRLRRAGVTFRPRLVGASGKTLRFADGST
jgi:hypothetical protein